ARGLRERTKSMEDVTFFLVGRIEGRGQAKSILPTHPCASPGETTAFRTSLTKYLEGLRHDTLYPKSAPLARINTKGKAPEVGVEDDFVQAWWWKDVLVRKSLLEECAGERFERMLLSFSTHALLKYISSSETTPSNTVVNSENITGHIQIQRRAYMSRLASYQDKWNAWELSASLLSRRAENLQMLRDRLTDDSDSNSSVYNALATKKLLALADSRKQDLTQNGWLNAKGQRALDVLIELAGLASSALVPAILDTSAIKAGTSKVVSKYFTGKCSKRASQPTDAPQAMQPLPIAAAHHPSALKAIRAPIFVTKTVARTSSSAPVRTKSNAEVSLSAELRSTENMQTTLKDSLEHARRVGEEMRAKLNALQANLHAENHNTLGLWSPEGGTGLDLDLHKTPGPELVASMSLSHKLEANTQTLEDRVERIRQNLHQYPPVLAPAPAPQPSRLPQPSMLKLRTIFPPSKLSLSSPPHDPPDTPKRLITSTPPPSAKPRSTYVHRFLGSAKKGRVSFVVSRSGLRKGRKSMSVRKSMAFAKSRPSMFAEISNDEDDVRPGGGDDVEKIVDSVQDESASNSFEAYQNATPKGVRLPSPYKSASRNSPYINLFQSSSGTPGPRPSFKIPERLSLVSLPGEISYGDDLVETQYQDAPGQDGDWTDEDEELDSVDHEGHSVALRDILLHAADTTQFDLLDGLGMESLGEASFAWE
ncbi:hypothetical protein HWV62_5089, partial [Athelia sp. TMB]